MKKKSVVLLSGGLDSVVNFKKALLCTEVDLILTFDYGQSSRTKEIKATRLISEKFKVLHHIVPLPFLSEMDNVLTGNNIPDFNEKRLDDASYSTKSAKAVWVPNRNGVFLNIAGAYADRYGIDLIITGFNKEEGLTFPDNSPEFIDRTNKAFRFSTLKHPKVKSYTIDMSKSEIVKSGIKISAPFEYVWSCYRGEKKMCGRCESCQRLKRALKENNYMDEFIRLNHWGFR
jgi:7-cyano-7-deazaguanine synthase